MNPTSSRSPFSFRLASAVAGLSLGLFASVALGACDDESSGGCVKGQTQECVCPGGSGAQTCQDDGSWGTCSCGGNGDGGNGDDGNGNGNGNGNGDGGGGTGDGNGDDDSSSEFSCCLNGNFYECPDSNASGACFSMFDPSACQAVPGRNVECDDNADSADGNGSDAGGADGSSCGDPGDLCASHGDCCDNDVLCVDQVCSAACDFDSDCVSGCCANLEGGGGACAPASFC